MKYSEDHIERFWSFVDKSDSCWIWRKPIGSKTTGNNPYGLLCVNGKSLRAHRVSWELHRGEIPNGMMVCHTCDVPSCVNPDHLFLGTGKENMQDCVKKGRHTAQVYPNFAARGENSGMAKLTDKKVFQIRRLKLKGVSARRIGRWIKMTPRTLSVLISGRTWRHVPFPRHEHDTLELHQNK